MMKVHSNLPNESVVTIGGVVVNVTASKVRVMVEFAAKLNPFVVTTVPTGLVALAGENLRLRVMA